MEVRNRGVVLKSGDVKARGEGGGKLKKFI